MVDWWCSRFQSEVFRTLVPSFFPWIVWVELWNNNPQLVCKDHHFQLPIIYVNKSTPFLVCFQKRKVCQPKFSIRVYWLEKQLHCWVAFPWKPTHPILSLNKALLFSGGVAFPLNSPWPSYQWVEFNKSTRGFFPYLENIGKYNFFRQLDCWFWGFQVDGN